MLTGSFTVASFTISQTDRKTHRSPRSDEVHIRLDSPLANYTLCMHDSPRNLYWVAPGNLEPDKIHPRSIPAADIREGTFDTIFYPNHRLCDRRTLFRRTSNVDPPRVSCY